MVEINPTTTRCFRHYREGGNPVRASAFSFGKALSSTAGHGDTQTAESKSGDVNTP